MSIIQIDSQLENSLLNFRWIMSIPTHPSPKVYLLLMVPKKQKSVVFFYGDFKAMEKVCFSLKAIFDIFFRSKLNVLRYSALSKFSNHALRKMKSGQ